MKHFLPILLVALLSIAPVLAQQTFQPGFIIQKGDTVKGLVQAEGVIKASNRVIFKQNSALESIPYTPTQVSEYGIDQGAVYQSRQIGAGDTAQSYFFKVLVQGHASLYSFRDSQGNVHYYISKNGTLQKLEKTKTSKILPNGVKSVVTNDLYKTVLYDATKDCNSMVYATIQKVQLKEKPLMEFVVTYNQCMAPNQAIYTAPEVKSEFTWGIKAGVTTASLRVSDLKPSVLSTDYTASIQPTGGLFVHATLPWLSRKITVQAEALYNKMQFEGNFSDDESIRKNDYSVNVQLDYLKVPLLVRYSFPDKSLKPFLNLGIAYSYALKHSQRLHITSTTLSGTVSQEDRYLLQLYNPASDPKLGYVESFRKGAQSVLVGGGIQVPAWGGNNLSLEARYEVSNGFSDIGAIGTTITQFSLMGGFQF